LKNLSVKKAKLKDIKFLFNLYNASIIEKYSKTRKLIYFIDHKNWFLKNINSKKNKIYIIYQNKIKIGYIRINIFEPRSCFISIYLKMNKRSKSIGSICLNNFLQIAKNKFNIKNVYAEVLKKNIFSKFFFKKNKFKFIKYSKKFNSIFDKKNYIFLRKI
tara:strand:+ start:184 stop:663 length:480 start_codon:yes stop_codon:yes gene_type:complete